MHTRPALFPRVLSDSRICIDEKCTCGCLRSCHEDASLYGNGRCMIHTVECVKFQFATYILDRSVAFAR